MVKKKTDKFEKGILYGVLTFSIIGLVFAFYTIIQPIGMNQMTQQGMPMKQGGGMGLTSFDAQLASDFMDKNHDGRCDFCGMRIEDCIASGMMQCSMDPHATIGLLRSQHVHADFKAYLNGKAIDFNNQAYFMKSMMMHVDNGPDPIDASGVLHMHATGVPLWLFFKSIGFDVTSNAKLYVNGKLNAQGLDYVFKDGDKLLITDAADQATVQQQISTITDYAKLHSSPTASSA